MKTSLIRYRVADFLKQSPPFDALEEQDLLALAATGRVSFHETDELVFRQGDRYRPQVWVIQQGTVELLDNTPDGPRLRDLLGAGDVLGLGVLRPDRTHYAHTAKTTSDVILYSIDAKALGAHVESNAEVARFLAAHFSLADPSGDAAASATSAASAAEAASQAVIGWVDTPAPSVDLLATRLVVVSPRATPADAARQLLNRRADAVAVVDAAGTTVAVWTRDDLLACLAEPDAAVPAKAAHAAVAGLPSLAYGLALMRARTPVLAITADGSVSGRLLALLSDQSLARATGRQPAQLHAALLAADSSAERRALMGPVNALLTETLSGPSDWDTVAELAGLYTDALAESVLRQALREAAPASTRDNECWLVFGRSARGEVSRLVRPDIGVVYGDLPDAQRVQVEDGHVAVVSRMDRLFAECGLALCDDQGAPSAPISASMSEWRDFFHGIVTAPIENDVYAQRQRLDFRAMLGHTRLADELRDSVANDLKASASFIPVLANDTMDHLPPLTFYQGLVIDAEGAEATSVDLGVAALGPLVDAARVLALAAGQVGALSTLDRLQVAAAWLPHVQARFNEAASAFRVVSYHAALASRASDDGEPVMEPATLSKVEQRLLKTAFESVSALIGFSARPDLWRAEA